MLKTKKFNPELIIELNINPVEFDKTRHELLAEWEKTRNDSCVRGDRKSVGLGKSVFACIDLVGRSRLRHNTV